MSRKDNRLQESLIETLEDGAIAIDKNGNLKIANQKARNIFDITNNDISGKKIWEIITNSDFNKLILAAARESDFTSQEKILIIGHNIPFIVKAVRIAPEGTVQGAIAILKDMSEFERIEKALNNYVANISHELKTPLTAIKGYIETLLEESYFQNPDISRKFLQIINDETNRMTRLIMTMLDISNPEKAHSPLLLSSVSVFNVINEAAALFKRTAKEKKIKIEINVSPNLPAVLANTDALKQVFINTIDNAVKFTGIKKQGEIKIDAIESGKNIKISIADTGIGIAPEYLEKIFERFYRVPEGEATLLGGTGLGLSITKSLIESMSGSIEVKSELGKGTKFTFTLLMAK